MAGLVVVEAGSHQRLMPPGVGGALLLALSCSHITSGAAVARADVVRPHQSSNWALGPVLIIGPVGSLITRTTHTCTHMCTSHMNAHAHTHTNV
jgi:hypothetical protein